MANIYVCTGGCGGQVTEEEYEGGIKTCQAKDCPKHGQPFTLLRNTASRRLPIRPFREPVASAGEGRAA